MNGYITNLEQAAQANTSFRRVLYTAKHSQLVLMHLKPKKEIGMELHTLDQFIRIEHGSAVAILDGVEHQLGDGSAVLIPAGTEHNIINTSTTEALKLYTVYCPPEHQDGTVQASKADALTHEEHFDGHTTE